MRMHTQELERLLNQYQECLERIRSEVRSAISLLQQVDNTLESLVTPSLSEAEAQDLYNKVLERI